MNQYNQNAALVLSVVEKRILIAQFLLGNWKVTRHIKHQGELIAVQDDMNPALILRAIAMDMKLEKQMQKEQELKAELDNQPADMEACETMAEESSVALSATTPTSASASSKTANPQLNRKQRRRLEKQQKLK